MSVKGIGEPISQPLSGQKASTRPCGDFLKRLKEVFREGVGGLDSLFQAAGQQFQISPALLKAVARAESGLNPKAVSRAGALGIMQLMPATARSLGVTDPFDPVQSIFGAAKYLRSLLDRFGGDIKLALAAYNAGPGAVQKWGGIPPYRETKEYIERVLAYMGDDVGSPSTRPSSEVKKDPQPASVDPQKLPDVVKIWADALLIEAALEIEASESLDRLA